MSMEEKKPVKVEDLVLDISELLYALTKRVMAVEEKLIATNTAVGYLVKAGMKQQDQIDSLVSVFGSSRKK